MRYTQDEIDRLTFALSTNPNLAMGRVGVAFLFAIETGMRAGEICALTRADMEGRATRVTGVTHGAGKTSAARREVPLSSEALRLLTLLSLLRAETTTMFDLKSSQMENLFRKGKERAMIKDRTFHDTRHLPITCALARIVDNSLSHEVLRLQHTKEIREELERFGSFRDLFDHLQDCTRRPAEKIKYQFDRAHHQQREII